MIDPRHKTIIIPYSGNGSCSPLYQWLLSKSEEALLDHVYTIGTMRSALHFGENPKIHSFIAVHIDNDKIIAQGYIFGKLTRECEIDQSLVDALFTKEYSKKVKELAKLTNFE